MNATMKPALDPATLYFGTNGECHCGKLACAGMTAFYTGRTIYGQDVEIVTGADVKDGARHGVTFRCETCKTTGGAA